MGGNYLALSISLADSQEMHEWHQQQKGHLFEVYIETCTSGVRWNLYINCLK